MKRILMAAGIMALCGVGCLTTRQYHSNANLLPSLRSYVQEVVSDLGQVSAERRAVLGAIASDIAAQLDAGKAPQLIFICTHNSRRSHMSQIWSQTAAYYYGLDKIQAFSGGTETT